MHRLFVGIRPPEDVVDLLIDAMDDGADFRWQDEAQLHLTLRFIGEVERPVANDVADALGHVRADRFQLRINSVGRFEQRSSGALWAGVEPREPVAALAAKVERVCQEVGLEPERRVEMGHHRGMGDPLRGLGADSTPAQGPQGAIEARRPVQPVRHDE